MSTTSRSTSRQRHLSGCRRPGVSASSWAARPSGAGPDGDIVGFSTICPHKGFRSLQPCRQDAELPRPLLAASTAKKGGQQIWGHATQNLPQYALRVDANGDIYADGVDELIYGRLSNVL